MIDADAELAAAVLAFSLTSTALGFVLGLYWSQETQHDYIHYLLHVRRAQAAVIAAQQAEIEQLRERIRRDETDADWWKDA